MNSSLLLRRFLPMMALSLVSLAPVALAQPNSVQVQLRIQHPAYRDELGNDTTRAEAEDALLKLAERELQARIGFLRFTSEARPTKIVIDLGDSNWQSGEPIKFHLHAVPGETKGLSWTFRSGAEIISALSKKYSVEDKIRDVELVGAGDAQPGEFRRRFSSVGLASLVKALGSMPVASKGDMPEGPPDPLWDLPLNRAETCMDLSSRFVIDHQLIRSSGSSEKVSVVVEAVGPDGSTSDAMMGHIQARVPATPDQKIYIQRLAGPTVQKVQIEGIYMVDYHPVDCNAVALPTDSGLGQGGPQ